MYVGEFDELAKSHSLENIYHKDHPLNRYYKGKKESRDWMFKVEGYYPSFFAFWKKYKRN